MTRRAALVVLAAVAVVVVAGCGDGGSTATPRTTLTVLAASSLTEAFGALVPAFEAAHPGVDVRARFGASSALAAQIESGGPGDVVVTADEATMSGLVRDGRAATALVVARNRLAIVVEKGNPKRVGGLADLARDDLVVVLCAPEVPCGRYARLALDRAGVTVRPRSLEENVKAVVAKVTLGEADAGIVYTTDVRAAAGEADGVSIAGADDPALLATYPAAVAAGSKAGDAAREFVEFLASPRGQRLFARAGFLPRA
jgi:molybdate transport system substrate-binding protein